MTGERTLNEAADQEMDMGTLDTPAAVDDVAATELDDATPEREADPAAVEGVDAEPGEPEGPSGPPDAEAEAGSPSEPGPPTAAETWSELDAGGEALTAEPLGDADAIAEPDAPEATALEAAIEAEPATDRWTGVEEALAAEQEPATDPWTAVAPEPWSATDLEAAVEAGSALDAEPAFDTLPTDVEPIAPEPPTPVAAPRPVTVAEATAAALHAAGVRWAFTVPGESFLGLLQALREAGIRVVAARHEAGAGFMAEAIGQLTSRPAVALGTRAVGGANLAIGVHTARQDSTPLIAILGQVSRSDRGREAFQEVDLSATVGGFAKWAAEPQSAADVPAVVGDALTRALTGRPGPVVLSFPEDLFDEEVPANARASHTRAPVARAGADDVGVVLRMLAAAERPVILAGAGVLRARCSNDLLRLVEMLRVPVIASWRRPDVIPNDHPLYLGMTGYGSPSSVRERLDTADALLVLGCRLNEVTSYGWSVPRPGLRWAHVDLEPRAASSHGLPAADVPVASDVRAFIRAGIERLQGVALDAETTDRRVDRNAEDRARYEAASAVDQGEWSGPGVHPGRVVAALRRALPDDAIMTTDAGNFAGWLARGFAFRRPGTFLGPTSGAMGYGLPAAIAAALVHRDRPVVAWTGDGGFAMTMAELETAVRERLRLVAIVLDNERYGMIRMHQDRRGADTTGTDLGPIDFATVARGLGADGIRVENDEAFEDALRTALASDRPTVLHLLLDRRWVSVDERP